MRLMKTLELGVEIGTSGRVHIGEWTRTPAEKAMSENWKIQTVGEGPTDD